MSRWPTKPLASLVDDLQPGFACRPTTSHTGLPQIRPLNLVPDGSLTFDGTKSVSCSASHARSYAVEPGDVLFNNTNSPELVGKVAVFEGGGSFVFSNHITRVRVKRDKLSPKFLHRYLFKLWQEGLFRRHCTQWVNQAAINVDALGRVEVPLPPLAQQERLVRILDEADALRKLRAQADQRTATIIPALFDEMFGDPLTNNHGLPTAELGEIALVERGRFSPRPRNDPSYYDGDYPFIQTGDIAESGGCVTIWKQTLNERGKKVSKEFPAGTIVIAIVGATIGQTAILGLPVFAPDSVVGIQPNSKHAVTEYVITVLQRWRPVFLAQAPETARANLNAATLKGIRIPVPPLLLQREFAARVAEVRAMEAEQGESRQRLDALFQSLLHRAFAGEL